MKKNLDIKEYINAMNLIAYYGFYMTETPTELLKQLNEGTNNLYKYDYEKRFIFKVCEKRCSLCKHYINSGQCISCVSQSKFQLKKF